MRTIGLCMLVASSGLCGCQGEPAEFVGITWTLKTYRVGTEPAQVFDADPRQVIFRDDGTYQQFDGCNLAPGAWSQVNHVLTTVPRGVTLKQCNFPEPKDPYLRALFGEEMSVRRVGNTLELFGANAQATWETR